MAARHVYTYSDDVAMIRHALYKLGQNRDVALKGKEAWEDFQQFGTVVRTTANLCSHFRKSVQSNLDKFRSQFKWEQLHKLYVNLLLTPAPATIKKLEEYYGIEICTNSNGTLKRQPKMANGVKTVAKDEAEVDDDGSSSPVWNSPDMSRVPNTPVNFNITEQVNFIKETAHVRLKKIDPIIIRAPIATSTPKPKRLKMTPLKDRVPSPPCNDTDAYPDRQPDIFDTDQNSPSESPSTNVPAAFKYPETTNICMTSAAKDNQSAKLTCPVSVVSSPPLPKKTMKSEDLQASNIIPSECRQTLFADIWKLVDSLGIRSEVSLSLKTIEQKVASDSINESDYKKCVITILNGINQSIFTFPNAGYDSVTNGNLQLELEEHSCSIPTEFRQELLNKIFNEQKNQLMILQKQFRSYVLHSELAILGVTNSEEDYVSRLSSIAETFKKQLHCNAP